ncbi:MAG: recombinase family protein [Chloroflexi bacterium]|uniref:recombinase family protein n=1 Tax=Candidatus Flexifilum breve TaxID=3140694 RepID=UPI003134E875|nr:recombinase family protein [Chloroflexota bacterium]
MTAKTTRKIRELPTCSIVMLDPTESVFNEKEVAITMAKVRASSPPPTPGWAIYLRTSSDENQKPELSRERQRFTIEKQVLEKSDIPVYGEYVDVLTGKDPRRKSYQQMLSDARAGKFSHVIVERADRFGRSDTEALRAIDELYAFGIVVRFANAPDLDPMDPDDRVVVALSFFLAQRESMLMGQRVKSGLKAKRASGGYAGRAPDGYINVWGQSSPDQRSDLGRIHHWIEPDPERAQLWKDAWSLLLSGAMTLQEIAFALHERGYRHRSGKPFVMVSPKVGKLKPITDGLLRGFQDWTYAGWVVSECDGITPKTVRGDWEPLISTEDFEAGLLILERLTATESSAQK